MVWTAFEHLRASGFAAPADPAIIGLDRDVAAALLCGLAAVGLMIGRARAVTAWCVVFGITYMLSARYLAGRLDYDALTYVPVVAAAMFVGWPRLIRMKQT